MDDFLTFTSRKTISRITGFTIEYDRGTIMKPEGLGSRVIFQDRIRSLYDFFLKANASLDEINEAIRRYKLAAKDKK